MANHVANEGSQREDGITSKNCFSTTNVHSLKDAIQPFWTLLFASLKPRSLLTPKNLYYWRLYQDTTITRSP